MDILALKKICQTHSFKASENHEFAQFSADFNPMHMDATYARKTQAGSIVVHGINVLVWALNEIASITHFPFSQLQVKCNFKKFIYLNDELTLIHLNSCDMQHTFSIHSNNLEVLNLILVEHHKVAVNTFNGLLSQPLTNLHTNSPIPRNTELNKAETFQESYDFRNINHEFLKRYSKLADVIGYDSVVSICMTSTVIGMRCPGLNSIYSAVDVIIDINNKPSDRCLMNVKTQSIDERFGLLKLTISTNKIHGVLSSFYRQPPIESPSVSTMKGISNYSLQNKNILIIGGSRGLGEAIVKITALSGANVHLTFYNGTREAKAIVDDVIASDVTGRIAMSRLNVLENYNEQLDRLNRTWDFVFYLATPKIFVQKANLFDSKLYNSFTEIYVTRFYALLEYLSSRDSDCFTQVYYPSTVAIHEHPSDLAEYAMSKRSAELLIHNFNKHSNTQIKILTSRLPRFESDQTATVVKIRAESAVTVADGILKMMLSA